MSLISRATGSCGKEVFLDERRPDQGGMTGSEPAPLLQGSTSQGAATPSSDASEPSAASPPPLSPHRLRLTNILPQHSIWYNPATLDAPPPNTTHQHPLNGLSYTGSGRKGYRR